MGWGGYPRHFLGVRSGAIKRRIAEVSIRYGGMVGILAQIDYPQLLLHLSAS